MTTHEIHMTSKGQVTIPKAFREALGIRPNATVTFRLENGKLFIAKASGNRRGKRVVAALRGKGNVKLSTDEIMKLTRE